MKLDKEKFYIVDFENDKGIVGCFGMDKELYDADDHVDLASMVFKIIDAWMKRRDFIHKNVQYYKKLC